MNNSKGRMFSSVQRKAFTIALCIIMLFTTGYAIGVLSAINVRMPMEEQPVAATTEITTTAAPTTAAPTTTEPTTETTTLPPETTTETTTAATTAAPEEADSICDMIRGVLGTVFPCLAEEETTAAAQ